MEGIVDGLSIHRGNGISDRVWADTVQAHSDYLGYLVSCNWVVV
jgi:hypothetical protein